jgi:hypothetical protein
MTSFCGKPTGGVVQTVQPPGNTVLMQRLELQFQVVCLRARGMADGVRRSGVNGVMFLSRLALPGLGGGGIQLGRFNPEMSSEGCCWGAGGGID